MQLWRIDDIIVVFDQTCVLQEGEGRWIHHSLSFVFGRLQKAEGWLQFVRTSFQSRLFKFSQNERICFFQPVFPAVRGSAWCTGESVWGHCSFDKNSEQYRCTLRLWRVIVNGNTTFKIKLFSVSRLQEQLFSECIHFLALCGLCGSVVMLRSGLNCLAWMWWEEGGED